MATQKFADRGYFTVNGYETLYMKSARCQNDDAVTMADTMSRNYRSAGTKQGNAKFALDVELEIPALAAQLDMNIQDPGAEINAVFECGGERYTYHNVFRRTVGMNASVGDATKSISLGALDCTNENGALADAVLNIKLA